MSTTDPALAERVAYLELRVSELEQRILDMFDPLRPRPPAPNFPIPGMPFAGKCFVCGGDHGSLPCPRIAPQSSLPGSDKP